MAEVQSVVIPTKAPPPTAAKHDANHGRAHVAEHSFAAALHVAAHDHDQPAKPNATAAKPSAPKSEAHASATTPALTKSDSALHRALATPPAKATAKPQPVAATQHDEAAPTVEASANDSQSSHIARAAEQVKPAAAKDEPAKKDAVAPTPPMPLAAPLPAMPVAHAGPGLHHGLPASTVGVGGGNPPSRLAPDADDPAAASDGADGADAMADGATATDDIAATVSSASGPSDIGPTLDPGAAKAVPAGPGAAFAAALAEADSGEATGPAAAAPSLPTPHASAPGSPPGTDDAGANRAAPGAAPAAAQNGAALVAPQASIAGVASAKTVGKVAALGATGPADQVTVHLRKAAEGKLDEITINLHPADLGTVKINLQFGEGNSVQAHIIAQKPETLTLLQQDAHSLHRALRDAGLSTDSGSLSFAMNQGSQGGQQQSAHGERQPGQGSPHAYTTARIAVPNASAETLFSAPIRSTLSSRRLDLNV